MPKIPDFSKFDLQGIINSVKAIITPEGGTPKVSEGDPIGAKIVEISTLLQKAADAQAQSAKDLTQINNLLNELYKDLEAFRNMESELRQKQQSERVQPTPETTGYATPSTGQTQTSGRGTTTTGQSSATSTTTQKTTPRTEPKKPRVKPIDVESIEKDLKKDSTTTDPAGGTSKPSDRD